MGLKDAYQLGVERSEAYKRLASQARGLTREKQRLVESLIQSGIGVRQNTSLTRQMANTRLRALMIEWLVLDDELGDRD